MKIQPITGSGASAPSGLKRRRPAAISGEGPEFLRERLNYQAETASLLAERIRLYTAGESSSVKEETAFRILGSIHYAINARTASFENPAELALALKESGVHGIYREGIHIVRACFDETKELFQKISENKLAVPLAPYNEMIGTAIPEFFQTYNIEFGAQDTVCSMDYPLAFDDITSTGIFYLNQYLKNLRTETEFCKSFSQREILEALSSYQVKFDFDITDIPLNLFSVLFDQSVFAALAGNEKGDLSITPEQSLQIANVLSGKKSREIKERINEAVRKMAEPFRIESPGLPGYMHRYQTELTERIIHANEYGNVLNLVLIKGEPPSAGQDQFLDGESMEDEEFSRLMGLIEECAEMKEKIDLINGNIHSSKDFIDLLEADCFYGDEYKKLYASLGNTELAILGKSVFGDELRRDHLHFSDSLMERYKKYADKDWQAEYIDFLGLLSPERKIAVEKLINSLTVSDGNSQAVSDGK